ncbi:DUF3283 family protein [Vibrio profundum]|uniref:DUF3283 family protein n=1 Tax=Vibrio profundum TaxID=2910247 RepID=UPI003D1433E1
MPYNLSLLPSSDKNRIEIDKRASYCVWQIKQGEASADTLSAAQSSLSSEQEHEWFAESVDKYKKMMGLA